MAIDMARGRLENWEYVEGRNFVVGNIYDDSTGKHKDGEFIITGRLKGVDNHNKRILTEEAVFELGVQCIASPAKSAPGA